MKVKGFAVHEKNILEQRTLHTLSKYTFIDPHKKANDALQQPPREQSPAARSESPGRRESLLEDWPRRASSKEIDQSGVSFSEFSTLRVYDDLDYLYLKKAYSKVDREIFGAQAMMEADRIKNLIFNSPPASVKESVKYLLKNNIITREELVGIDHLILRRRKRVLQVRRNHMAAVLRKQNEQRRQQPVLEEDCLIDLGKFAEQSSLKSTHSAIARATL
eukprot:scaffold10642_cov155-Skeletonema_dohrnii-CCMP3373.AAC.15